MPLTLWLGFICLGLGLNGGSSSSISVVFGTPFVGVLYRPNRWGRVSYVVLITSPLSTSSPSTSPSLSSSISPLICILSLLEVLFVSWLAFSGASAACCGSSPLLFPQSYVTWVIVPFNSNSTNDDPSWVSSRSPIPVGWKLCRIQWWWVSSSGLLRNLTSSVSSSGDSPYGLPTVARGSPASSGCPVYRTMFLRS